MPGILGAPIGAAAGPSLTLPTVGEDRSLICVTFLSLAPLLMSPKSAPCDPTALRRANLPVTAARLLFRCECDVLFLLLPAVSLLGPSCPALAAAAVALPRLVPWAAWAEGEVVVEAWCRVSRCGSCVGSSFYSNSVVCAVSCCLVVCVGVMCVVFKRSSTRTHSVTVVPSFLATRHLNPRISSNLSATTSEPPRTMKPGSLPMRVRPRPVCQLCDYILQQPVSRRAFLATSSLKTPSIRRQTARTPAATPRTPTRTLTTRAQDATVLEGRDDGGLQTSERIAALKTELAYVESRIREIYDSPKVETEAVVLGALDGLENVAQQAIAIRSQRPVAAKAQIRQSSAGAKQERKTRSKQLGLDALPSPSYLSKLAEALIRHEKVFLSPNVLAVYIHLQRLLVRPKTIPEALYLFANKPVPIEGSSPPKFSRPSPKSAKQAIPADLADEALTAAIDAKDLSLALDVVDHTYRAPAWRRHRMVTKMGLPAVLAGITPLALYMIAQELSVYSGYIDPWTFKLYAFAGMSTYVMCTGTLGFVALTTYNDHHDRVVWRPGVPLLDRYFREDERAALDRIACAWGFKEIWKRGDEEGEDWEGLRQWILLRGMVLDKPDLMHGMNPGR
jgi:hypothetical protein